jgi:hypothetical protein
MEAGAEAAPDDSQLFSDEEAWESSRRSRTTPPPR